MKIKTCNCYRLPIIKFLAAIASLSSKFEPHLSPTPGTYISPISLFQLGTWIICYVSKKPNSLSCFVFCCFFFLIGIGRRHSYISCQRSCVMVIWTKSKLPVASFKAMRHALMIQFQTGAHCRRGILLHVLHEYFELS